MLTPCFGAARIPDRAYGERQQRRRDAQPAGDDPREVVAPPHVPNRARGDRGQSGADLVRAANTQPNTTGPLTPNLLQHKATVGGTVAIQSRP